MNYPGPSPETEIDNPYNDNFATEEPVFHRFPEFPQEVRDMIWDWTVDHDSAPDVVLSSPTFPNTPFLFQVCRESLAACLRRYTIFRHPDASSTGDDALEFFAWINYERDVLELNDCFDRQAGNREHEGDRLMFAEICPEITHLKIIFSDWGSSERLIPHKRCLKRLDMNNVHPGTTIDRILHDMEEFIALHGSLSYEVEITELAPSSESGKEGYKASKISTKWGSL
ncbi:hypothetical protein BOTNAR_0003g00510 [Botryotinia narcissicola]|uniref:2EXR domain-containing protein n=1 Tax=Botryotinia narcissicola TaxID=278944 RepID=A0A4Z1JML0_9HELO|nr:hypothetical protein BOTNAR_0003g00510 [Botryotinia narcissicola]